MNEILNVNELITWNPGQENEHTERILWIEAGGFILYVIDAFSSQGLPISRKIKDVINAIESGDAVKREDDPLIRVPNENSIKESDKLKRDKAWSIIVDIVSYENEPDVYEREKRGQWVSDAVSRHDVTYSTVYKYLRRFWQRGKNKNALLPDYYNSGGKGKRKTLGVKKIGRPRKNIEVNGPGINVDEATKKVFRLAVNKYYDTPKENFMTTAYNLMVKEFYREDYRFEDGIRKPTVIPIGQIPTITQFRYWYEVEQDIKESLTKKKGSKKYALSNRAVLGKSDTNLIGPGSKYQIDATVADVYLVSRFNRTWIIGRPVIYAIIDCFSRMVTGIYVGLEGPSWIGAMMALSNAFTDKVGYCKDYGINILQEDWPSHHVPLAILGDRGEMESYHADTLVNGLDVRIENTPSFRADWKGIIEKYFNLIDVKVKPLVPGHIDISFRERGGTDYRLDAKLDIYQFTQIIINCVLYHNNQHWMKKYSMSDMMVEEDVDPIPRVLWNWGISNRSGKLRAYPKDKVKMSLMPEDTATVTEKGLKFKSMYYSSQTLISDRWFEIARNKGSWRENIAYDPRNMNLIYIKKDNDYYIKCEMLDKRLYTSKTLDEIEYLIAYQKLKLDKNQGGILQSEVDLFTNIENIVQKADKMTSEQRDKTVSNAERTKNIRERRRVEKGLEKIDSAFVLGEENENIETNGQVKVIPLKETQVEQYKYPSNIEYLRKKQKERMEKRDE